MNDIVIFFYGLVASCMDFNFPMWQDDHDLVLFTLGVTFIMVLSALITVFYCVGVSVKALYRTFFRGVD